MANLHDSGQLPNLKAHISDRGCFRIALTVFPSTTGPAHIPFVAGVHPGTANIPGYRWLCRHTHDNKRRSIYRHRSLNSPRGLVVGRDMNRKCTSLFEHFDNPSSVLELIDYCRNQTLYKIRVRRLFRVVQAHRNDNWDEVDNLVESSVIKRIKADSKCIIASFFGIDEYSHLYDPFDNRTVNAYKRIDRAIGKIADCLKKEGVYDETILAVVSDHGLSATKVHIPVADIAKENGFDPFLYPEIYRRKRDSAVLESGNAMAQLYFKRGDNWGEHWRYNEMRSDKRIDSLMKSLTNTEGISLIMTRDGTDENPGGMFVGKNGTLRAIKSNEKYDITIEGENPLPDHPIGQFTSKELFNLTYEHTYPDAVNQLFMICRSARSGDLFLSADPGYDLRLQYEHPEHKSSHGSLHREHMKVPIAVSVPFTNEKLYNYDIVPTILALCNKHTDDLLDGKQLDVPQEHLPSNKIDFSNTSETVEEKKDSKGALQSILTTIGIILTGLIIVGLFKDDIFKFGEQLLTRYGQDSMDIVLFLLTALSSTPLALPIWGYALVGIALGYSIFRLAIVMAFGSALGSYVTFALGRYYGRHRWVKKKFPDIEKHPWTAGKSRKMVTLILFFGTASPIPCDVLYVACGAKRFPPILFLVTMVGARFVRYIYLGYLFKYFGHLF